MYGKQNYLHGENVVAIDHCCRQWPMEHIIQGGVVSI